MFTVGWIKDPRIVRTKVSANVPSLDPSIELVGVVLLRVGKAIAFANIEYVPVYRFEVFQRIIVLQGRVVAVLPTGLVILVTGLPQDKVELVLLVDAECSQGGGDVGPRPRSKNIIKASNKSKMERKFE